MEDRVITHLEKEHSHRFRTMCHKNANLAQENKVLLDHYDREKKRSLHSISLDQAELKDRMVHLSQERYVNSLLNHLTKLAFEGNGDEDVSKTADKKPSLSSITLEDGSHAGPRYLRMETNAFHPSEMSLGSTEGILETTTSNFTSQDSTNSFQIEENKPSDIARDNVEKDEELVESKGDIVRPTSKGDEELQMVVDKLTDSYDIEKLKFLTQVLLKTLQKKDRFKFEEKKKLVYNLNRYFNSEADLAGSNSTRKSPAEQLKQNNTFLYLKADRQKEILNAEHNQSMKKRVRSRTDLGQSLSKGLVARRSSVPVLPDIKRISTSLFPTDKDRRHSLHADWKPTQSQSLLTEKRNLSQTVVSSASTHNPLPNAETQKPQPQQEPPKPEHDELDDMMKIYLRLGHGALLNLPRTTNRATVREKQKSWLRRDLKTKSIISPSEVQDLRVVMKNCRYLRFPKDMIEHFELLV